MVAQTGGQASLIGKILGNYAVKALIGRGAMGTVYLAKDVVLGRHVALKVLLGAVARDPEYVKRFQLEAKTAAPLKHPNIVGIYEAGIRHGTPFIAMEYIEGEPLDSFLRRKGVLRWQNALHIARLVAQALDCAHEAGVVHRDVKSANILLDRQGRVRLTDFGIANVRCEEGAPPVAADFFGTPAYMSPEQCSGHAEVAPSSDLFSLGIVLFKMLSGRMPFEGNGRVGLIRSITSVEPPRLNQVMMGIPDDVARLTAYLLEKDPRKRPASARAVCGLIERIQRENGGAPAMPKALNDFIREETEPRRLAAGAPTPVKKPGHAKPAAAGKRKRFSPVQTLARIAAVTLIAAALAGAAYWHFLRQSSTPGPAPELAGTEFTHRNSSLVMVPLPGGQWRVRGVRWVGDRSVAVVAVEGPPGSAAQGAQGLLAVDVEAEHVYSVHAPSGAILDAGFGAAGEPGRAFGAIPSAPEDSPLHEATLIEARGRAGDREPGPVLILAQRWNEAASRSNVLYAASASGWNPRGFAPWSGVESGAAIVKPGGRTLCLLLNDPRTGGNYLAERDVHWRSLDRVGPRLTTSGEPIIPSTIQYSPDGSRVAYMRRRGPDEQQLWVVASDGLDIDGKPIAIGQLSEAAAFSPDGARIAVGVVGDEPGGPARLLLANVDGGAIEDEAGPGRVRAESWHPAGQYLVVAAPEEETGQDQLWAVDAQPPYRRTPLTKLASGILDGGGVARNGRWTVAVVESGNGHALVFVDLSVRLCTAVTHPGGTGPA